MNKKLLFTRIAALLVFCACGAFGQLTSFNITDIGSGATMGQVYTSPYTGTIGGVAGIKIICDDFIDDVLPGQSWTAYATQVSDLSLGSTNNNVYFGDRTLNINGTATQVKQATEYIAAAMLALDILTYYQTNSTLAGQLSYALWGVFDPLLLESNPASGVGHLSSTDLTAARSFRDAALVAAASASPSDYTNVTIYTPWVNGAPDTAPRPQEFIAVSAVSMAEAPSIAIFAFDLLAVAGLVLFARRRMARVSN
jgi:hypothetical protein